MFQEWSLENLTHPHLCKTCSKEVNIHVFYRIKLEEDSVEHGKLVSAMTKERLKLDEKVTELNKSLTEVRLKNNVSTVNPDTTNLENNVHAQTK